MSDDSNLENKALFAQKAKIGKVVPVPNTKAQRGRSVSPLILIFGTSLM